MGRISILGMLALAVTGCEARPLDAAGSSTTKTPSAWLATAECNASTCPWGMLENADFAARDDAENWVLDQVSQFAAWSNRPTYPELAQKQLAPWSSDYWNLGLGADGGVNAVFTICAIGHCSQ